MKETILSFQIGRRKKLTYSISKLDQKENVSRLRLMIFAALSIVAKQTCVPSGDLPDENKNTAHCSNPRIGGVKSYL